MITSSLAPGVRGAMRITLHVRDVMSLLRSWRRFAVISTGAVSRFRLGRLGRCFFLRGESPL